jgi:primosomal protein N''
MATAPQPSVNFHARIDLDTEERRRRLQAQTGLSASHLVRQAFRELEQRLNACRRKPTAAA